MSFRIVVPYVPSTSDRRPADRVFRSEVTTMTHRRTIGTVVVLGAALAACAGDDTLLAPEQGGALVGVWQTAREPLQPQGSMQSTWTIAGSGRIEQRIVMYGVYPGDGASDVSAEIRQFGRIGASATAFVVHLDSAVTHDAFYGPTHRDVQRYPIAGVVAPRDSTFYVIAGGTLRLTYYSYPADAPVLTHSTMVRVR
jgi:hypothetical protein